MNTTLGVGKVLGTGFRVWFRNLIPFLLLTAAFHVPPWLWAVIAANDLSSPDSFHRVSTAFLVAGYSGLVINVIVSATLTYGVVMELQGNRASIGACISTGLTRFLPALAVAVLSTILVWLGSMLLIVPGLVLLCRYYVVTQVMVLERHGVLDALGRSGELTQGHKWRIFGLWVVLAVLSFALNLVVTRCFALERGASAEELGSYFSHMAYLRFAVDVITGSLSAVMASVAYYYLRAEKEGTSAAELAAIFD